MNPNKHTVTYKHAEPVPKLLSFRKLDVNPSIPLPIPPAHCMHSFLHANTLVQHSEARTYIHAYIRAYNQSSIHTEVYGHTYNI